MQLLAQGIGDRDLAGPLQMNTQFSIACCSKGAKPLLGMGE
jgi:hypothetical protein